RSMLVPTGLTLKEIEKRAIEMALQRNNWKKLATARELGINKNTLRRKIKRLRIVFPQQ
ncbi:MAG: sigma-54-dependent Fis family transcriptional regulator, partial [Deltaproteobacteria bacterium]|nr:sigma-54-dependent Fis family transcriptional regulator [Deltaproteobacteria bacterium]